MAEFVFVVEATISLGIQVEAETLEEAVQKAKEAGVASLQRQVSQVNPGEWHTSGEIDCGPPGECRLVDAHGCDFAEAEALWAGEGVSGG